MFLLCLLWIIGAVSFRVNVPDRGLVAIRGCPAVLVCEFTPDPDLSSLVVTWQRGSRVVHSFYYQQDQLDRQSPEYHNRTSLFISELGKGKASLRINSVGPKDVGQYLCHVSSAKGTGKAQIELKYGALYSEPRLNIHVNSSTVTVQFETDGFPKPEVIWLGEHGQNLSYHLELHDQTEDGLYFVKSSYKAQKPVGNVTFTLKNPLLNQNLQRPVTFSYVSNEAGDRSWKMVAIISMSISVILLAVLLFLRFRKPIKLYL
ncbi:V-set domain-containing T-cell activation inhibitor 1-like isoform X1 [Pseudorasbora parva]|uniref:V-set domain-containing T-cell activation inhibitor 1-like isoform X1 n=1 Tax=Pseudorasbora parva TaxID=51549 RepID=UPI00351F3792